MSQMAKKPSGLKPILILGMALSVAGCEFLDLRPDRSAPGELKAALDNPKTVQPVDPKRFQPPPGAVEDALLPELLPRQGDKIREPRFDVSVVQVEAREFFMGLVADSDYNVIVDPEVSGKISISLKSVSLPELLEAVRDVYGYDYKKTSAGYIIYPAQLISRIFHVDYLNFTRTGRSETRVSSGASPQSFNSGTGQSSGGQGLNSGVGGMAMTGGAMGSGSGGFAGSGGASGGMAEGEEIVDCRSKPGSEGAMGGSSSRLTNIPGSVVATNSASHFWRELKQAVSVIVCDPDHEKPGRAANFVVNQQSGVVVVSAMPKVLREVEVFLEAVRREVQRQVVLEARILEVELKDSFQAGIDWASVIQSSQGVMMTTVGAGSLGSVFTIPINNVGKLTDNSFAAYVELLERQGNVNTLSAPRIATLNNQKAVIKVGVDELHVSNVSPGTFVSGTIGGTGFAPSPVLSPFFSGIALDVTPQIDDAGNVTLHVHPSVTEVTDKPLSLNFGNGEQAIPLANSQVRESDSVVHAINGQIVVIGGLMKNQEKNSREGVAWLSRLPGLGSLFRRGTGDFVKSELVILLKPTIIQDAADWNGVRGEIKERYRRLDAESRQDPLP